MSSDEVAKKRKRYGSVEKVCANCGKKFLGRANARYCSRKCANTGNLNPNVSETLCWSCKHATNKYGRCSWSRWGLPVPGWKAIVTKLKALKGKGNLEIRSYIVRECPLYEKDE